MTAGTLKDYCGYGTLAARPASPAITAVTGGSARYYATDTGQEFAWDGTAWQLVAGELAYAQITTGQSITGATITDVTSLTVTATLPAGPVYIEAYLPSCSPGSATQGQIRLIDVTASNAQKQLAVFYLDPTTGGSMRAALRVQPGAGSRQYKVAVRGGVAFTVDASSIAPAFLRLSV